MKIATNLLKEVVNNSLKGTSNNALIPITQMIGIKLNNNKLHLLSTDMTNTLEMTLDKVLGDDIDITVEAEKFGKLISKMTSPEIDLSVKDDVLIVKGNGTYKIPLISDEEGLVSFPEIPKIEATEQLTVKLSSIMSAFNINKSALAKTLEQPCLTGYYCGDNVISTDSMVITFNKFNMFNSKQPLLISPQMMNLMSLFKNEDIKVTLGGADELIIYDDNIMIYGTLLEGIEDYPVEEISRYLDVAFDSYCKIPKALLLSVLDRLQLFIEPYDKNGAYFNFTRKGLNIHSRKDASTETINYIESHEFKPFTCLVDIPMLKEQLQAYPEDTVKLWYGDDNAIKLECGKVIQVIALLEDEEA